MTTTVNNAQDGEILAGPFINSVIGPSGTCGLTRHLLPPATDAAVEKHMALSKAPG